MPASSLSDLLSRDCDGAIQQRGAHYFRQGRVRIVRGSASRVTASVRGSSVYHVELVRGGPELIASCTCPYFDVDLCKHIWATVLAADARQFLRGNGRPGRVRLVHAGAAGDEPDGEDNFDDDDDFDEEAPRPSVLRIPRPAVTGGRSRTQSWRARLAELRSASAHRPVEREVWGPGQELLYVIDIERSKLENGLSLEILCRERKQDGTWSKPKPRYFPRAWVQQIPSAGDRHVLACLTGASALPDRSGGLYAYEGLLSPTGSYYGESIPSRYRVPDALVEYALPLIGRTGRCRLRLRPQDEEPAWLPAGFSGEESWELRLAVRPSEQAGHYELRGECVRDAERMDLSVPLLLLGAGFVFLRDRIARLDPHGAFDWIPLLREPGAISVPTAQGEALVAELLRQPRLPPLDLPEELRYEEIAVPPRLRLAVTPASGAWARDRLCGQASFDYGGEIVASDNVDRCVVQATGRRVIWRDRAAELAAAERLRQLGWRAPARLPADERSTLELAASRLPQVVRELTAEGWHVEAHGKIYRSPGRFELGVSSGVDWFELHGTLEFGDTVAHLPELLAAVKRGEGAVRLGDGSFGLLPERWLERYGLLAGLGTAHEDHVRFMRSQAGLLDVLLAAQPAVERDAVFSRACEELQGFSGIEPADPPHGFRGELRPYQKDGLGWMGFLRRFGFGGCLADDMGLGKTVQVLALLEARRELRHARKRGTTDRFGPSLVVVPKSLIFNWMAETERFAPRLRLLDHTGPERSRGHRHFERYDLILTTYGTLRRDAADFKDVRFDYVILDEAQAIKNADSASAKAARLLEADHRLALSGTPVQNHLGELWSLMEFLNPGLLGTASVFRLTQGAGRDPDESTRKLLAQALRPFLLRRTKEQVIRDLPPKVEQTLYCELESRQRRLYGELRDHYRGTLLKRIEREGLARSKIQILEALLRLRQAALHPGLIDERRSGEPAAKLETLLPRLEETLAEGHKVLVFSQFTSMLEILRGHLDRDSVRYEYLDGRTRDREGPVTRFQTEADCKLFLISLKAGGLGLNLTAAQYVFLLDPWWNPAIEAQAIDRAHRIGQVNRVFAYRLIARNTIEEKVLELQSRKRDLAEAIIGADQGLIRDLRREDLEQLLS